MLRVFLISSLVAWQRLVDVKHYYLVSIVNGLDLNLGSLKDMFYFEILLTQTSSLLYVLIVSQSICIK